MKLRYLLLSLVLVFSFGLAGCDFGQVDQGRTVAFDKKTGTVTLILDVKHDQLNPDYSGGLAVYKIPTDLAEMGPDPVAGGRLKLDADKKEIIIFNPLEKAIQAIPVEFTDIKQGVKRDDDLVRGKKFPIIDKAKGTITEYSRRQQLLATFKVPTNMAELPAETWEAGDEVRLYFKQAGVSLRLMNISKTNIFGR